MTSSRGSLLLACCWLLLAVPASAQAPRSAAPTPEELRTSMARRLRALTGEEAQVGELRYEILASRLVGRDIVIGKAASPLLRLGRLSLELTLFSGASSLKMQRLEASAIEARLPADWLERAISPRAHRAAQLRVGRARGEVKLVGQGGTAELGEVELSVSDLEVPAAGPRDPFRASGSLKLRVARVSLGGLLLERLVLEGRLQKDHLLIERLEAELLGGRVSLSGRLGLIGSRPGPLDLRGTLAIAADTPAGSRLRGKLRLRGRHLQALQLEGRLLGSGQLAPARGSLGPAPALRLRLKLGKRQLRGTPAAWELR